MSDPNATAPGPIPADSTATGPAGDWREQRRAERAAARGAMRDSWPGIPLFGLAIVAVGVVFLGRNFGFDLPLPDRWWAITILLPAAGFLVSAARFFRMDGGYSSRVAGAATLGVLLLATALILFLDLDWGKAWPVMVIIVGLGVIARGYRRR
jgi:hypothetical protein